MPHTPNHIIWGVCGIGHGHIFRQKPLIDHFAAAGHTITIFAYGESLSHYRKSFAGNDNIHIAEVAVPFYIGNATGLDFEATAALPANQKDYVRINGAAMAAAHAHGGKPTLVVSDYEPVSAQLAYAHGAPLVTIDQQSKYLTGAFPEALGGTTYADEVARLGLFFPRAEQRLASTFFRVAHKAHATHSVMLCPAVLGDAVTALHRAPGTAQSVLVYLTAQRPFDQSLDEITAILASQPDTQFHLFGKNLPFIDAPNVRSYQHGDSRFHSVLASCHGIISTAGHTLLSEAMHLGIPVYAMPLPLYEQQMNAHVIAAHNFGVSHPVFDADVLRGFLANLPNYAAAIAGDKDVLLRGTGQDAIIPILQQYLG